MQTISGYVEHIIFQNSANGYTVLNLVTEEEEVVCVGTCKGLSQGETISAQGETVEHPVYGTQFRIASYQAIAPKDRVSMERYLGSGAVKGVGAALAARIVKKFGDDTFRIMEEEPERLVEVKGISERKAREIAAQMEEKKDLREALVYLQQYGISNSLAIKIYDTYGIGLYGVLKENPYRLAEDIAGVGFKIADEIAARIGVYTDSDYRIRCGLIYVLQQAAGEGHCYLPMELLLSKAQELLGVDGEDIRPQVENLMMDRKLVIKGDAVFKASYYYAELNCARMLWELNLRFFPEAESAGPGGGPWEADPSGKAVPAAWSAEWAGPGAMSREERSVREKIQRLALGLHMELDVLQQEAVLKAVQNGVFLLSGGPGTGKTTTINMIIHYFESEGMDILLAAPTGRAAKRMTEATGYEARTIHRLLELSGEMSDEDGRMAHFMRNEENPLEADVIIIDEMSMVDLSLFQALLKALVPGMRLILVGDVNQLPSVGPGQVLRDLMDSGAFPTIVLQRIFRQARGSDIVVNAHRINLGEQIALDNKSRDFFLLERSDANVIYKHMIQLIRDMLPRYVKASSYEIQVLTPMRKGPLGAETLNGILQQYMNPPAPSKKEHQVGSIVFREGDKVMQVKNDYQLEWEIVSRYGIPVESGTGVFNGDVGRILSIDEMLAQLTVEFDEQRRVTYAFAQLEELELSYAITIHKSQGSEYPAVILPLLGGPRMLFNRNLLYTGVTRAKSCVVILGSGAVVRGMIENASENRRYTALGERIRELLQESSGAGTGVLWGTA